MHTLSEFYSLEKVVKAKIENFIVDFCFVTHYTNACLEKNVFFYGEFQI